MASINANALDKALGLFAKDEDGRLYLGGAFGSLKVSLAVNAKPGCLQHQLVQQHLRAAANDIWNISALVERLEWMRGLAIADERLAERWRTYAQLDVAHIFLEFRSIFDHVACAIAQLSDKPGVLPESFEKLIKKQESYAAHLGVISDVLKRDFSWFYDLRVMRTAIIHLGSEPLVFCGPADGLLFQLHDRRHENMIQIPEFMFNPNVVRFEPYVAYYFAELLYFLNDLSSVALSQLQFNLRMDGVRNYSAGYVHLVTWMTKLRGELMAHSV